VRKCSWTAAVCDPALLGLSSSSRADGHLPLRADDRHLNQPGAQWMAHRARAASRHNEPIDLATPPLTTGFQTSGAAEVRHGKTQFPMAAVVRLRADGHLQDGSETHALDWRLSDDLSWTRPGHVEIATARRGGRRPGLCDPLWHISTRAVVNNAGRQGLFTSPRLAMRRRRHPIVAHNKPNRRLIDLLENSTRVVSRMPRRHRRQSASSPGLKYVWSSCPGDQAAPNRTSDASACPLQPRHPPALGTLRVPCLEPAPCGARVRLHVGSERPPSPPAPPPLVTVREGVIGQVQTRTSSR